MCFSLNVSVMVSTTRYSSFLPTGNTKLSLVMSVDVFVRFSLVNPGFGLRQLGSALVSLIDGTIKCGNIMYFENIFYFILYALKSPVWVSVYALDQLSKNRTKNVQCPAQLRVVLIAEQVILPLVVQHNQRFVNKSTI